MSRVGSEEKSTLQVGRFSTQLLEQFGAQNSVANAGGSRTNTFKNSNGSEHFANPSAVNLSSGKLTPGAFSNNVFSAVRAYFESRGASGPNADAMASIAMDVARLNGVSPISLLDYNTTGKAAYNTLIMNYINRFRPNSQPQEVFADTQNKDSLRARQIRA